MRPLERDVTMTYMFVRGACCLCMYGGPKRGVRVIRVRARMTLGDLE